MSEGQLIVEGRVLRVVFANPETGYGVVRLVDDAGTEWTIAGRLGEIHDDDRLRSVGEIEEHPRYGRQFTAQSSQTVTPRTLDGIRRYLAGARVKGIGPELARRLVEAFGSSTFEVLDETPDRLAEVDGIGPKRRVEILKTWRRDRLRREAMVFLQGHGLGPAAVDRALDALGDDLVARVRADPFILADHVKGIGFRTADAVAGELGVARDAPSRLASGVRYVLEEAVGHGHLALPGPELLNRAGDLLGVEEEVLRDALRTLSETGSIVIARPEHDRGNEKVFPAFAFHAEIEAAERLTMLATTPVDAPVEPVAVGGVPLSVEQRGAVGDVLASRVSVLTGGPGVGKTTVLRAVVASFRAAGLEVALASPTGRAARRLAEVCGEEASTVHRLLQFDGYRRTFAHGDGSPHPADVIVIDEVSMLDLPLLVHLLRALTPKHRLLLVGDADQLPSVGPGSVLADVIASGRVTVARLTRIFRQDEGGAIVRLAHDVLRGNDTIADDLAPEVYFMERPDPEEGARLITDLVTRRLPAKLGPGRRAQVLAPMHKGAAGTRNLNHMIQDVMTTGAELAVADHVFRVGDRVMQVRNDHDRELSNGDLGDVVSIDETARSMVVSFPSGEHEYRGARLVDLRLAWAITVHKSQGGEYEAVVLPLYPEHQLLLKRQVLYTAITRARRLFVMVGVHAAFSRAVLNDQMSVRYGHFNDWLAGSKPWIWKLQTRA